MGSCREKGAPGAGQEQQWGCWPRCQPGAGAHECPSQGRTRGRPHAHLALPAGSPGLVFVTKLSFTHGQAAAHLVVGPLLYPGGRGGTGAPRTGRHQRGPQSRVPVGSGRGGGLARRCTEAGPVLRGRGNKGRAGDSFREDTSSSARSALPVTQPSPHRCEGGELSVDADPGTQALRTPGSLPRLCLMDGTLGHCPTARPTPRHPAPQPSGASAESTGLGVGVSSSSFPTKGTCSSWVTSAPSSLNQG